MQLPEDFERERARLTGIATRVLDDRHEAEDIVQRAWLRLHGNTGAIENLPAWLTTVTVRLCIDRLRARTAWSVELGEDAGSTADTAPSLRPLDPAESAERIEAIGQALQVVVDRLTPNERVALVLHESLGFDFDAIGRILDRSPAAARKLGSRARAKVAGAPSSGPVTDRHVVDAFMAAARGSDLDRLLALLAPGATVRADAAAIAAGSPGRIDGRAAVASFFDGSAHAALPVFVGDRAGAAWFHRGRAMVAFDFTVVDGVVFSIVFRAEPEVLAGIVRRSGDARTPEQERPAPGRASPVTSAAPRPSSS